MYNRLYNTHICGAIFLIMSHQDVDLDYVTQKIVHNACEIYLGKKKIYRTR